MWRRRRRLLGLGPGGEWSDSGGRKEKEAGGGGARVFLRGVRLSLPAVVEEDDLGDSPRGIRSGSGGSKTGRGGGWRKKMLLFMEVSGGLSHVTRQAARARPFAARLEGGDGG